MIYVHTLCDNLNMEEMGSRLRKARERAGFKSARSAAIRHGWTVSTYNAHENGQNDFDPEAATIYGKAFGVSPGWLLTGQGLTPQPLPEITAIETFEEFEARAEAMMRGETPPERPPYEPEPNAAIQPGPAFLPAKALLPHDVPELGLTVGGRGDDDSVFELNGTTVDYHPRPPGLARRPNVFVLRVANSSMSPRFEDGDIEYIELKNPSVGEYVVVELKPEVEDGAGRSYIKKLVKADGRKIVVEQFNPPGFMEFGRNEIYRLFRVITDKKELIG
ncbi:XRE family transcriptional regulator [Bosea sp. TAF32]|uniref:XRE family transcriptional regulator n=1 Tax=Bosea sp. TAF32 TaxID=3237482 RepID=UPI003F922D80